MQINAQLDTECLQKLDLMAKTAHTSESEIIRQALDFYFKTKFTQGRTPTTLKDSSFVGCGEADPDLSENYKAELTAGLEVKHDYR